MNKREQRDARRLEAAVRQIEETIRSAANRVIDALRDREVRLAISQKEMARRIAIARRAAGLTGNGCSVKTIQRMERGQVSAHCGYSRMTRYNASTCQAWLNEYIASECGRLRPDRAVRFNENLAEHNG